MHSLVNSKEVTKAASTIPRFREQLINQKNPTTLVRSDHDAIEINSLPSTLVSPDHVVIEITDKLGQKVDPTYQSTLALSQPIKKGFQIIGFYRTTSLIANYLDGPTINRLKCVDKYLNGLIYSPVKQMNRDPFIKKELEMREELLRKIGKEYSTSIFCRLSSYQQKKNKI